MVMRMRRSSAKTAPRAGEVAGRAVQNRIRARTSVRSVRQASGPRTQAERKSAVRVPEASMVMSMRRPSAKPARKASTRIEKVKIPSPRASRARKASRQTKGSDTRRMIAKNVLTVSRSTGQTAVVALPHRLCHRRRVRHLRVVALLCQLYHRRRVRHLRAPVKRLMADKL